MLEMLRRASTGNIAKVLMSLLIISFGIWGIQDVFKGYGVGSVASVGNEKISSEDFDRMYRAEINSLSIENERRISQEEARKEGIDRLVLSKMISQSALEQQSNDMKLALSMESVAAELKSDPNFFGPDGKFSRLSFDDLLSRLGISENFFLNLRRSDELRQQITSSIIASINVPKSLVEIINQFRNETRSIEFFKIDKDKAIKAIEPDETKLKTYYEDNKTLFMTSEYRKFNVLIARIDDLKNDVSISEDDIKSNYEQDKQSYDIPEKRRIQQISFIDKNKAEEARVSILNGTKSFMDLAKEQGAKESDVNLGLLSRAELIDKKIAEKVFSLERDAISEVVEGKFTNVLLRVIEIEPGHQSTYEESKDKVKDKLATKFATNLLQERIDLVEEGKNAGKTLQDIAIDLKLKFFEVPASNREGKAPDGSSVLEIENSESIIRKVFQYEPGTETDPFEIGSNGYAWVDVINIEPPKQKSFETANVDVKKIYMDNETNRNIKELADTLIDRLNKGEDFKKIAEEQGGKTDQLDDVKRNLIPPGLTEEAIKIAFSLPLNSSSSALTSDRSTRTIFKVIKIEKASQLSKEEEEKLANEVGQDLQNDILLTYVQNLQEKLGVSINDKEFNRIMGVENNP